MATLEHDDFGAYFEALHGYSPFPWQQRLATKVANEGRWPSVLDLPTGAGKTAVIDIAVFCLALEAARGSDRSAPVRIAFVVDRRLIVDDAFNRAKHIQQQLAAADARSVLGRVAERLRMLSDCDLPLIAQRLRGGIPREVDWARTPAQPTVLCSTVDQIGSRLLFRGYGVSDRMKPVHAGLIGSDCMIFLDEAHLAEPFRQTLRWVSTYRGDRWRDPERGHRAPWGATLLTATPGERVADAFGLKEDDHANAVLARRLAAAKPVKLVGPIRSRKNRDAERSGRDESMDPSLLALVEEAQQGIRILKENGLETPAVAVVVNRVYRARAVFETLKRALPGDIYELGLMIGPSRPVDREMVVEALEPLRTRVWKANEPRLLTKTTVIVATQCIEAGVDIDLDGLVTELAPLDALRQRFGRLNRAGRPVDAYGAIVVETSVLGARYEDPIYGTTIQPTWELLKKIADEGGSHSDAIVDFGWNAFRARLADGLVPAETLSPKADAPILLPAHLDLLTHTSPVPAADPEVALYLHGADREPDAVSVIWRADVDPAFQSDEQTRRLLLLLPPRSGEAIDLPRWVVRRWLGRRRTSLVDLGDVAGAQPLDGASDRLGYGAPPVFRWRGDDERSTWISSGNDPRGDMPRPGDTIIVPTSYGGADQFGWNPDRIGPIEKPGASPVDDVADEAARPFSARRFVVRIAPGLLGASASANALAEAISAAPSRRWSDLREAVAVLPLPDEVKVSLSALDHARGGGRAVKVYDDLHGYDDQGRPRGVVFVALFGLEQEQPRAEDSVASTEDDLAGSLAGFALPLETHSADVAEKAAEFASAAGLPDKRVADLRLAGYLHDAGKIDPRFQAWLHFGDPLGPDPGNSRDILAKSGRFLPNLAREAAGLPAHWRHEALSVRLAMISSQLAEAEDPDLVLWLIGAHHGFGHPLFPHADPDDDRQRVLPDLLGLPNELAPGPGPQSTAFDWNGVDWPTLYDRLKARYGVWELARMEAVLRLADHRASDYEAHRAISNGGTR